MRELIKRFVSEEEGDFIQWLIIALVIGLGVFTVATTIRTSLQTKGTAVQNGINGIT
jgi:Flp pilus assembly pilin Flp